jgi:hypothetical protein
MLSPRDALQVPAEDIARGWATLRAFDCARCHGRDLRGWSAPDLVAAVREGTRERFDHYVLTGDVVRGMPGYRSQAAVVADLDAIYAYLRARAEGRVGPGAPAAKTVSQVGVTDDVTDRVADGVADGVGPFGPPPALGGLSPCTHAAMSAQPCAGVPVPH